MKTYIALLRGINVSGQKIIEMKILRNVLLELDLKNIRTYIQSGNILFESKIDDIQFLENQITDKIQKHFAFEVPLTIVTPNELKMVVSKNPFIDQITEDASQPYVAFLSKSPNPTALETLNSIDFGKDQFINIDKTLYLFYAISAGKTKLTNSLIESKLQLKATTRNWKTIHKLIELTEEYTL